MNKTTKFLTLILIGIVMGCSISAKAQTTPKFGLGITFGVGTGEYKSTVITFDFRYLYYLEQQFLMNV